MKVLISGASGFLGSHLRRSLKMAGGEVVALERNADALEHADRVARWDGKTVDKWIEELETADVLVNLAGLSIGVKWTEENKRKIRDSRIETTSLLAEACRLVSVPPKLWINMSGIGIYRTNLDEPLDELGQEGTGFAAELVRDWENAFFEPEIDGIRRVALRAAPVLGHGGGAFDIYVKLVKWFIGGPAGSGEQWMSWIHVADWVRMVEWAMQGSRDEGRGPKAIYNACAPEPVRNKDFMAELRKACGRPWAPPAPEFAIKLFNALGGPEASLALDGQRIVPKRALEEGFEFRFPTLPDALRDLQG